MSSESAMADVETRLEEAARVAIARQERTESPQGDWRERLWYPAPGERQACCQGITPTAANRQALESHCRTQAHVANLFNVSAADLRRAVKRAREVSGRSAEWASGPRSAAAPGGRVEALYEVSRGAHGAALQELRSEAKSFERILPRLIAASEEDEGLLDLFAEAASGIENLRLTLEYCRRVETTYDAARAVRDLVESFYEDRKKRA